MSDTRIQSQVFYSLPTSLEPSRPDSTGSTKPVRKHSSTQKLNTKLHKRKIRHNDIDNSNSNSKRQKQNHFLPATREYQYDFTDLIDNQLKKIKELYLNGKYFKALHELKLFCRIKDGKYMFDFFVPQGENGIQNGIFADLLIGKIAQEIHAAKNFNYEDRKFFFDQQHEQLCIDRIYKFINKLKTYNIDLLHSMATLALNVGKEKKKIIILLIIISILLSTI